MDHPDVSYYTHVMPANQQCKLSSEPSARANRLPQGKRGVEMISLARKTFHRVEELLETTNVPSGCQFSYPCNASKSTVQTEL